MQAFTQHQGLAVPMPFANIDTDQIIPKQFLQKTTRTGFAEHLFHDWRYLDANGKQPNPDFCLNQAKYQGASILIAKDNFGCGSSREHAPWALQEFGFKVIIAPSFADIFYGNSINIGLLPIKLTAAEVNDLLAQAETGSLNLVIDLTKQSVHSQEKDYTFSLDEFHRQCLLEGIDSIGWTLSKQAEINAFEQTLAAWQ